MSINFNHLKTFCSALIQKMKSFRGNWNQNDPTADDYIKNRPFYSEVKKQTITLVDNLTSDTDHNYWPKCTFIPGQSYDVTYNGVLYPNLVCYQRDGWNIICNDVPCHIDDDGGNSLYIDSNDDSWIISITTVEENEIIHKLDKKFIDLPKGLVTEDSLENTLENNLAPVAFTNSYDSLDNKPTIYTDVVRYNVDQWLTDSQKKRARFNIDVYSKNEVSANYMQMTDTIITMPSSSSWNSITYGNGKFVAISKNSVNVAYSENSITWQASTLPMQADWQSITYGNDKFVAIAYGSNNAAYSEDGITWYESTLPSSRPWNSTAYGNGKFIAMSSGNEAAYSEDGTTWHKLTLPQGDWCSVTHGNGKFVAISSYSTKAIYSEDGITWQASTLPKSLPWQHITYGNGKFVVVAIAASSAAYSEDGIIWHESNMPSVLALHSVAYGNGKFVAADYTTNKVVCSTNGITWNAYTLPSSADWESIAYGDGKFVAVAKQSNKVVYSEDGITWTDQYKIPTQNGVTITPKQLGFNKTDLTGYATETYVDSAIATISSPSNPQEFITLIDEVNAYEYRVVMRDGMLTSFVRASKIEITTMPIKTEYIEGEFSTIDLTGMVVSIIRQDGSKEEITNYTHTESVTDNTITVKIEYVEFGESFATTFNLSITPFDPEVRLVDFEYVAKEDGTYTLTGWKGTLNGAASTEMVVPNSNLVVL